MSKKIKCFNNNTSSFRNCDSICYRLFIFCTQNSLFSAYNWIVQLRPKLCFHWYLKVSDLAYFWCCQLQSDIFIGKFKIFKHNHTQNILTFEHQLCCLQRLEKINLAQNGINSWTFSCPLDYHDKNVLMNFNFCIAISYSTM